MFTLTSTYRKLEHDCKAVEKTLVKKNQEFASANKKWKVEYDKLCVEFNKRGKTVEYLRKQVGHIQKTVHALAVACVGHDDALPPQKVMTNLRGVEDYILDLRTGKNELQLCVSTVIAENRALKKVSEERNSLRLHVKGLNDELEAKTNENDYVEGEYNDLKAELEKVQAESTALRIELLEKNKQIQKLACIAEEESQKHTSLVLKRKRSPSGEEEPKKRAAM